MQNFFHFFHLPQHYSIDMSVLDANYRKIQAEVHPDKYISASPAERMQSMQTAAMANEAYQTLKHPTSRARYLLKLAGVDTAEGTNTVMPADFLMRQMEWREVIEDAHQNKDIAALDSQLALMQQEARQLQANLQSALEDNLESATEIVRKLSFIDKVSEDVKNIINRLEN